VRLDLIQDPESIRVALGVTRSDVTDTIINNLMIAYQAEVKVKGRITYWAGVLDGTRYGTPPLAGDALAKQEAQVMRLRMAANYYAAGLLARRLRGGAIPLVSGGVNAQLPRDWEQDAKNMFASYGQTISEFEAVENSDVEVDLPSSSFALKRSATTAGTEWQRFPPIAYIGDPIEE
jgi:hypothetical protein